MATIDLHVQFLVPVKLGDFNIVECQVVKAARTLMLMQGTLRTGDNVRALVEEVWKISWWWRVMEEVCWFPALCRHDRSYSPPSWLRVRPRPLLSRGPHG